MKWRKFAIILSVSLMIVGLIAGLVVNAYRLDRLKEARSLCWSDVVDSYCEETGLSDDDVKCVRKILPDGAECREWKANFCELSCVCKGGKSQKDVRKCDDGNQCTEDFCVGLSCYNQFVALEGVHCGQDQGGVCFHGFCVMLYDTIYTDFP